MESDRKDYIDNLNLDLRTLEDMENLLIEFEEGRLSRDEYLMLQFLSHSVTHGRGFKVAFENRQKTIEKLKNETP